jgi:gliding motility-associated-like protein
VFKNLLKTFLLTFFKFLFCIDTNAQLRVTIPWSSSLNQTFGNGSVNPGPLSVGYTDFVYTTDPRPSAGFYSVINSTNDAGHIFFGPGSMVNPAIGYKLVVCYAGYFTPKIVFGDTVRNLCSNSKYLFWAGINNIAPRNCLFPNLTFSVETLSGVVIKTFQTGDIGGPADNFSAYYGYYDTKRPPVPFYGRIFQVPVGVTDVVVKIITNTSTAFPQCTALFEIDNIMVMPIGPGIKISTKPNPDGWLAASCFEGDIPLVLDGNIESGYPDFGISNYISASYANPAFQWQQSVDDGYTWIDIPGETNLNISHIFNNPDTFWVRLRGSEAANIANPNCSNVSNVIKVQVDGIPKDYTMTSNSPVCTNGDLKINLSGGASYNTFGPNSFFDNSPFPHIYYPLLADSGWYRSEIISYGGCKAVDSVFVKVYGPNITVSADKLICYGDTVHLHATGGAKYNWSPEAGLSNSSIPNPIATPHQTTRYEVVVSDNTDCTAYGHVMITLRNSVLKASIDGPDIACPGDVILFKDTSIGKITSRHWDFGNGNTSILQNPPVQYYPPNGAFYSVKLTIADSSGCEQTAKKILKSANNCFIAVPNAFTPNNDGLNDFLYPLNAYKATHLSFKVFDRWGRLVFENNDWTRKWDGSLKGEPQATGVYVWMLTYTDENQKQIFLKGTVALIR